MSCPSWLHHAIFVVMLAIIHGGTLLIKNMLCDSPWWMYPVDLVTFDSCTIMRFMFLAQKAIPVCSALCS